MHAYPYFISSLNRLGNICLGPIGDRSKSFNNRCEKQNVRSRLDQIVKSLCEFTCDVSLLFHVSFFKILCGHLYCRYRSQNVIKTEAANRTREKWFLRTLEACHTNKNKGNKSRHDRKLHHIPAEQRPTPLE